MQQLDRDEVSLLIHAPAERLYALVADVTRTPEFSPSVVRCTWINGATGPAVGARFEAVNTTEAGKTWRNRPVVTVADPGREFAFSRTEPLAGTLVWRYRFAAEDGGTRVTESYEVTRPVTRLGWFVIERIFKAGDVPAGLRAGMRTTLERLQAAAESHSTSNATHRPTHGPRGGDDGDIHWTSGWVDVALVVFLLMSVLGPTVEAGHAKRLLRLAAEPPDGPVPPELDAARRASAGVYVSFFGVSQILAFLYLMTNKPGLLGACTACVVAAVLSALLAAARLRALTRAAPIGAPPVSAAPDGTPVHDRG